MKVGEHVTGPALPYLAGLRDGFHVMCAVGPRLEQQQSVRSARFPAQGHGVLARIKSTAQHLAEANKHERDDNEKDARDRFDGHDESPADVSTARRSESCAASD